MDTIKDGCKLEQGFGGNATAFYQMNFLKGHPGIDKACGYGTPILSSVNGIVYSLFTPEAPASDGYTGIYILCRTGLEVFEFTVGHVSKIVVSIGQSVKIGDLLGYEGNRGVVYVGQERITLAMQAAGDHRGSHRHYQKRVVDVLRNRKRGVPTLTTARGYYRDIAGNFYQWALPDNGYNSCVDFSQPLFVSQLKQRSSGYEVTLLQRALGIAKPTGYFGPQTWSALIAFQKAHGLDAVGWTGPRTRAALNALYGPLVDPVAPSTGGGEEIAQVPEFDLGDRSEIAESMGYNTVMETSNLGIFGSSVDQTKLAATWAGIAKFSGAAVGFLVMTNLITAADGSVLTENVTTVMNNGVAITSAVVAAYGAAQSAFGILRKLFVKLGTVL